MANNKFYTIKEALSVLLIVLTGCVGVVFSVLYIQTFTEGFVKDYFVLVTSICVAIVTILTILSIVFIRTKYKTVYKSIVVCVVLIALISVFLYFLKITGFLDKVDDIESFRKFISSYGSFAVLIFILIQFLQVVVLPIPAFITVGAGVLLFGPLMGAIYSCIGIILGSIVAFYIGRLFGNKVAKWLVGEQNLQKGLNAIKGKDKIVLIFMFLFPFFPDDILCFVAGITTISSLFFVIMIFVTRIISVFCSSYSINNSIIPYNTWWGILLWVIFIGLTIILTILIYKKGDKIERYFAKKFKKKKASKNLSKKG